MLDVTSWRLSKCLTKRKDWFSCTSLDPLASCLMSYTSGAFGFLVVLCCLDERGFRAKLCICLSASGCLFGFLAWVLRLCVFGFLAWVLRGLRRKRFGLLAWEYVLQLHCNMIERNEFSMIEHRVHGDTANTVKASTLLSVNRYCNMIGRK